MLRGMTPATPPETASNAELIRWTFDIINTHDIAPLKPYWTESTTERFPDATCVGPEQIGASWQGIAPTGNSFELDGVDHFVLRDGKIESNFVVFDQLQFARQIGMMPADGSTADRAMKAAFNGKTRLRERIKR